MKRLWMDGLGLVAGLLGSVFTNDIKAVQRLSHPQREAPAASSSTVLVKRLHFHQAFPFASLGLGRGVKSAARYFFLRRGLSVAMHLAL
jgi:hypothetical protein